MTLNNNITVFFHNYQKNVFIGSTAKNGFQIRIVQQKIHNIKEKKTIFLYDLKGKK